MQLHYTASCTLATSAKLLVVVFEKHKSCCPLRIETQPAKSVVNSSAETTRSQGTSDAGKNMAGENRDWRELAWRRHQGRGLFQTNFPLAGSTVPISKLRRASPSNHSRSSVSMRAAEASLNSDIANMTRGHTCVFEYSRRTAIG